MQKKKIGIIVGISITIIITAIVAIFAIHFFTKTGVFHQPGVIVFEENISDSQRDFVNNIITSDIDLALEDDIIISSQTRTNLETSNSQLLYNILVPTTDFYDPTISINTDEVSSYNLTPILELTPQQKLLALDENIILIH